MKKLTHADFVTRARLVHGNRYQYPEPYAGSGVPLGIICPEHGRFLQTPNSHLSQAQNCPKCARTEVAQKHKLPPEELLRRFRAVHGDAYQYDLSAYVGVHTPISIICAAHGVFRQAPHSHAKGSGCPLCAVPKQQGRNTRRQRHTQLNFAALASNVHKGMFDYTDTVYTHNQNKVVFRCIAHNRILEQTARDHLDGYNPCTQCNHMKSAGEQQVFDFLSTLTKAESRNRTILKPKELDIYLPDRKLAVEYCGEYRHSAGSKDEERAARKKHIEKYRACKEQGVRLITLWESEWKERNYAIRRLLRNAVGKSKGKLMARKCELRKATPAEARAFYDRYHPQGGAGSGEHFALFWKGKMVACMRFVLGANDRGAAAKDRVWTLGRYATRITVAGAASRLFKAFVTEFNPPEVKSFSDNRFFDGGMYAQLGFVLEEEVPEDYVVWSPKIGIRPKPHYQRRQLPKRLEEHGMKEVFDPATDPRTEAEMTYFMGARRLYDCGKKRWVWTPEN